MTQRPINVLFLCTHNSARSILAEATLNHIGKGRFRAFSAGSSPRANQQPNPLGLQVLREAGIRTDGLRSKSWDEFADAEALNTGMETEMETEMEMDLIITVCDNAAGEVCPVWPGHPATAHWSYADPSEGAGDDAHKLRAFRLTLTEMRRRLDLLISLPPEKLARSSVEGSARNLSNS